MLNRLLCAHDAEVWQTRTRRKTFQTGYWCPDCRRYRRASYRLPIRRHGQPAVTVGHLMLVACLVACGWLLLTL